MWQAEQPLFKHLAQIQRYLERRGIIGNTAHEVLFVSTNAASRMFLTAESIRRIEEDGKKLLDPGTAKKNVADIKRIVRDFWVITRRLRSLTEGDVPLRSRTVVRTFQTFRQLVIRLFAYVSTTWEPTNRYSGERLRSLLNRTIPESTDAALETLMTPSAPDLLLRERRSWLSVLTGPSRQRLMRHMLTFPYLFTNIDSEKDSVRLMMKRLRSGRPADVQKEIQATNQKLRRRRVEQQRILRRIRHREIRDLAALIQRFTILRLELKNCWSGVHFILLPFYRKLATDVGQSIRDCMMFWSFDDILTYLKTGKQVSRGDIARRKKSYTLLLQHGRVTFTTGEKSVLAQKLLIPSSQETIRTLRGVVASRGHVRGRVRVIDFDDLRVVENTARSIREKFILVTGMTNPNTVPLIKKAKAIVTDEGGITCHAAIISREYNLPCIIGTRTATRDFKTGDLVDVDANQGLITLLSKRL